MHKQRLQHRVDDLAKQLAAAKVRETSLSNSVLQGLFFVSSNKKRLPQSQRMHLLLQGAPVAYDRLVRTAPHDTMLSDAKASRSRDLHRSSPSNVTLWRGSGGVVLGYRQGTSSMSCVHRWRQVRLGHVFEASLLHNSFGDGADLLVILADPLLEVDVCDGYVRV